MSFLFHWVSLSLVHEMRHDGIALWRQIRLDREMKTMRNKTLHFFCLLCAVLNFDVVSWDGKMKNDKVLHEKLRSRSLERFLLGFALLPRWLNFPRVSFTAYHNNVIEIWCIAAFFAATSPPQTPPSPPWPWAKVKLEKNAENQNFLKAIEKNFRIN